MRTDINDLNRDTGAAVLAQSLSDFAAQLTGAQLTGAQASSLAAVGLVTATFRASFSLEARTLALQPVALLSEAVAVKGCQVRRQSEAATAT